ncbi:MAG: hypothetical protein M3R21_05270 [Candidatus Dormibacteraeota bacterium]|nr:hypothetical protein [Candidatus Dormibacteraeota bacterium]
MATEAPIKVSRKTHERARLMAAVLGVTQGEIVDRAMAEFIESHADDLSHRVERARSALLGGDEAMLAYLSGVDAEEIKRLGGVQAASR